jgi:hypothetical protein
MGSENEKACRGRRCGRLSKRTEQRLGGGVSLFLQTSLGGGMGRLKHEVLREEVHRFVETNHMRSALIWKYTCCIAAMLEVHASVDKPMAHRFETKHQAAMRLAMIELI